MIKPICDKCMGELTEFGGLMFSPPDINSKVTKWHLCVKCYESIVRKFTNFRQVVIQ